MIYQSHRPQYPLSHFIEHLWFHADYNPPYERERLLPEGVVELIIDMQDHPKKLYQGPEHRRVTEFKSSWISGQRLGHIVIQAGPSTMMGVRFRPAGAWPFLPFPVSELTDQVVPMELVWGRWMADLRARLIAAKRVQVRFRILEAFLWSQVREDWRADELIEFVTRAIAARPHGISIGDLVELVGCSHKHLIERFKNRVGLAPKAYARIQRFQRVVAAIEQNEGKSPDWIEIARVCGYYDQSHFINDFRSYSGFTPTAYLDRPRPFLNYLVEPEVGG